MEQRKRSVVLIYGEQTTGLSIKVPASKKNEIRDKFYALLKEYENPSVIMVDCFGLGDSSIVNPKKEKEVGVNKDIDLTREFSAKSIEKKSLTKTPGNTIQSDYVSYEYIDSIPLGSQMTNIIGHNVHKHYSDDIFYCKLPFEKGYKIVVLYSEKEVKAFIRKELIK